ncbi:hypothetical protein RPMD05_55 [Rhodobacteraceae phage LS06-2018-MD05]|nr:hypothetical protein RPMD05_55 [Rhodobacteraceae phage LS06-2018-MD05]
MATKSNKYTQNTKQGIESYREIAIETKEFLNRNKKLKDILSDDLCGLENTCDWGAHNPNFDKNNI